MRFYASMILLIFLYSSCNNKKSSNTKVPNTDTLKSVVQDTSKIKLSESNKKGIFAKDTTLTFSIEGLSAESSEVEAHYINDTIRDAKWNIFGETGQWIVNYKFQDSTIKVIEKRYTYKSDLTNVKSDKDMKLQNSLQYLLDKNGILLSKTNNKDFVDIFSDFKKNVPMTLSN